MLLGSLPRDRITLAFMDEARFHEGVPANFKGLIPACQVSPLTKYSEYSPHRGRFVHRRLSQLGDDKAFLPLGLFGNPTNWFGSDGTGCPPLSTLIPDLRLVLDRHKGLQILIDYSWEAGLGAAFFRGVDAFVNDLKVPANRVLVLTSNEGIEARYWRFLRTQQKDPAASFRVVGADLWLMYSALELQRKHWYELPEAVLRGAEIDDRRSVYRQRKYLSFNRRPRWHRFLLALMIGDLHLREDGFISMSSPRYQGDWISEDDKVDDFGALMAGDVWDQLKEAREKVFQTLPWTIDLVMDQNTVLPDLYKFQDRGLFADSYCQIVTESYMEGDSEDIFITEKICRPLANMQPFLLFGHSGSIRRLRRYGFEPSSFFDEAYDGISDLGHRLTELYRILKMLKSASIRDLHDRYHAGLDVLYFNREHLFEMPSIILARLGDRLNAELWN